uniref:Endonuclease/exonuclease/phosphatase domain-containing protein n=1 Tax=Arion vulgaris TaxID=1028688 RepID=A0A0B7AQS3_9EUPU
MEQQKNIIDQALSDTMRVNIIHWNAEGIYNKKQALAVRLASEKIDVACIQETHLNPQHRFSV